MPGCILPCHGGIYLPSQNFSLCLNQSHYDNDLLMPKILAIMERMKTPCKISEILYGPMHTLNDQNSTRLEHIHTCCCNCFPRLQLLLPPSLYRTEESMKMTTTSLQVFSLNQKEKFMSKCSSLIRIFPEQHRGLPGSLPRCVSFAG